MALSVTALDAMHFGSVHYNAGDTINITSWSATDIRDLLRTQPVALAGTPGPAGPAGPAGASGAAITVSLDTGSETVVNGAVVLVSAASAAVTITLPATTVNDQVTVKKTDSSANTVTVVAQSGTIDGAANDVLSVQYAAQTYVCDGTNWWLI